MNNEFPLRHIACHYLDAYCRYHGQVRPMSDDEITRAWVHFHELITSFEIKTMMIEGHRKPVASAEGNMETICAIKKLVSQFASVYFGYREVPRVRGSDLDAMCDYFRQQLGEEFGE